MKEIKHSFSRTFYIKGIEFSFAFMWGFEELGIGLSLMVSEFTYINFGVSLLNFQLTFDAWKE